MQYSLKLFWYKVFVHQKLKLLNFLMDSVLITLRRIQVRGPRAQPPLLLDQADARRAETKSFLETAPPLKVWIGHCYLVYQACSTESLQLGKILMKTKKGRKAERLQIC